MRHDKECDGECPDDDRCLTYRVDRIRATFDRYMDLDAEDVPLFDWKVAAGVATDVEAILGYRLDTTEARIWCDEAANAIRVSFREDGETTFSGRFGDGPWNAVVNMLHATGILPRPGDPSLGWKPPQRRREAP